MDLVKQMVGLLKVISKSNENKGIHKNSLKDLFHLKEIQKHIMNFVYIVDKEDLRENFKIDQIIFKVVFEI